MLHRSETYKKYQKARTPPHWDDFLKNYAFFSVEISGTHSGYGQRHVGEDLARSSAALHFAKANSTRMFGFTSIHVYPHRFHEKIWQAKLPLWGVVKKMFYKRAWRSVLRIENKSIRIVKYLRLSAILIFTFWGSSRKSLLHATSKLVANKELRAKTISSGSRSLCFLRQNKPVVP